MHLMQSRTNPVPAPALNQATCASADVRLSLCFWAFLCSAFTWPHSTQQRVSARPVPRGLARRSAVEVDVAVGVGQLLPPFRQRRPPCERRRHHGRCARRCGQRARALTLDGVEPLARGGAAGLVRVRVRVRARVRVRVRVMARARVRFSGVRRGRGRG